MRPVEAATTELTRELTDLAQAQDDAEHERFHLELYGDHKCSPWEPWRPYYGPWWPAGYSAQEVGADAAGRWSTEGRTAPPDWY